VSATVTVSRGPKEGFIGTDGRTHAKQLSTSTNAALRAYCKEVFWRRSVREVGIFRVTPGAPLCTGCVAGIESEIRRES
jgi:hypothetical protein